MIASGMRLSRDQRAAAPVDKRGPKENTACRQTGEAAYSATRPAQVHRIGRERPMDERQQTDR